MSYNKKAAEASAPFIEGKNFFDGKKGCPQSYVEAFYHFSEALASDETNSEIYCYRGRCLMSQGYFIEALFDFSNQWKWFFRTCKKGPQYLYSEYPVVGYQCKYEFHLTFWRMLHSDFVKKVFTYMDQKGLVFTIDKIAMTPSKNLVATIFQ